MFTPKANSKQKRVKKTQEYETRNAYSSAWSSLPARLSDRASVMHNFSWVCTIFHPKTQILITQHPNSFPKVVYRFMYTKRLSKTH